MDNSLFHSIKTSFTIEDMANFLAYLITYVSQENEAATTITVPQEAIDACMELLKSPASQVVIVEDSEEPTDA